MLLLREKVAAVEAAVHTRQARPDLVLHERRVLRRRRAGQQHVGPVRRVKRPRRARRLFLQVDGGRVCAELAPRAFLLEHELAQHYRLGDGHHPRRRAEAVRVHGPRGGGGVERRLLELAEVQRDVRLGVLDDDGRLGEVLDGGAERQHAHAQLHRVLRGARAARGGGGGRRRLGARQNHAAHGGDGRAGPAAPHLRALSGRVG
mmetsp:Transcript_29462/g.101895  ORF Transcript_29462/g.101895 Transcript_29462/m.101895 type:complete len:204 (+) Transcript_29462:400-1011(+)